MNISYLLFECPGLNSSLLWLDDLKNKLTQLTLSHKKADSATARETLLVLNDLIANKNYPELFKFVFGCCCKNNQGELEPLRHIPVLAKVVEVTATRLRKIQDSWIDAALLDT